MRQFSWTCIVFLGLVALCASSPIVKRQALEDNPAIDPSKQQDLSDLEDDENRDKRKVEDAVELKYGAKNAILGLIFNKLNSFIDTKTRWVAQLDQSNIAKNRQYGIEAPKDAVQSFGTVFSSVLTNKLQQAGPIISIVTSKLGGLSAGGSSGGNGAHSNGGGSGGFLGSIGALLSGASGGSSGNHEASASISFGGES